ncbi:MAG: hypothetical protein SCARUB_04184 [Candidatus Scalindua rubra]|uniref:Uncharacterized protein n=1 Tax=Candidatus Scalindua rubra TaxID=1872076 RepID=A0A1E3X4U6_9BACT|nr:MAG: hypothetical protein SCARUB_04184 [Candidatus Scalindua rubra]
MRYIILLLSGILSSIFFISTFIFAEEEPSFLFKGFDFPIGETTNEFVNVSFDDLFNIFGNYSTLTDSQKKESWHKYKGKYVRWEGIVNHKGLSKGDWNRVGIRHNVGSNVELRFDEDRKDIVKMIKKGDSIAYTGKLSLLFDRNLLFKLEDANIETINDMSVEELKSELEREATLSLQSSHITDTSTKLKKSSEGEIGVSFDGLNKIFGKNSSITQSRKEELWNNYRGKHIRWEGVVNHKGLSKNDWNRVGIKHKFGTNIELRFDEDKKGIVKVIKRGDNITYTGKLAKLFGRNLLCSIEDVSIKKIGDKIISEDEENTLEISYSSLPIENDIDNVAIIEPEIAMTESMAPKVIEKEDIEIAETTDGFIKLSLEELDEIFGKENNMTESQKDKLWEEYKNKYVRWTGEVMSRGKGRISGLRMGIKHKEGTDVELCFDIEKDDEVLQTKKGDTITYTGKLVTRRGYILPYKLEDGNIENIMSVQLTADQER